MLILRGLSGFFKKTILSCVGFIFYLYLFLLSLNQYIYELEKRSWFYKIDQKAYIKIESVKFFWNDNKEKSFFKPIILLKNVSHSLYGKAEEVSLNIWDDEYSVKKYTPNNAFLKTLIRKKIDYQADDKLYLNKIENFLESNLDQMINNAKQTDLTYKKNYLNIRNGLGSCLFDLNNKKVFFNLKAEKGVLFDVLKGEMTYKKNNIYAEYKRRWKNIDFIGQIKLNENMLVYFAEQILLHEKTQDFIVFNLEYKQKDFKKKLSSKNMQMSLKICIPNQIFKQLCNISNEYLHVNIEQFLLNKKSKNIDISIEYKDNKVQSKFYFPYCAVDIMKIRYTIKKLLLNAEYNLNKDTLRINIPKQTYIDNKKESFNLKHFDILLNGNQLLKCLKEFMLNQTHNLKTNIVKVKSFLKQAKVEINSNSKIKFEYNIGEGKITYNQFSTNYRLDKKLPKIYFENIPLFNLFKFTNTNIVFNYLSLKGLIEGDLKLIKNNQEYIHKLHLLFDLKKQQAKLYVKKIKQSIIEGKAEINWNNKQIIADMKHMRFYLPANLGIKKRKEDFLIKYFFDNKHIKLINKHINGEFYYKNNLEIIPILKNFKAKKEAMYEINFSAQEQINYDQEFDKNLFNKDEYKAVIGVLNVKQKLNQLDIRIKYDLDTNILYVDGYGQALNGQPWMQEKIDPDGSIKMHVKLEVSKVFTKPDLYIKDCRVLIDNKNKFPDIYIVGELLDYENAQSFYNNKKIVDKKLDDHSIYIMISGELNSQNINNQNISNNSCKSISAQSRKIFIYSHATKDLCQTLNINLPILNCKSFIEGSMNENYIEGTAKIFDLYTLKGLGLLKLMQIFSIGHWINTILQPNANFWPIVSAKWRYYPLINLELTDIKLANMHYMLEAEGNIDFVLDQVNIKGMIIPKTLSYRILWSNLNNKSGINFNINGSTKNDKLETIINNKMQILPFFLP